MSSSCDELMRACAPQYRRPMRPPALDGGQAAAAYSACRRGAAARIAREPVVRRRRPVSSELVARAMGIRVLSVLRDSLSARREYAYSPIMSKADA